MDHHETRMHGESGTSLIELMFGAAIATTLLLAVSTSVASQSRTRRIAEQRNLAMVACRNALESVRETDFALLPTLNGTGFDVLGVNGMPGGLRPVPGDADGLPGSIIVATELSSGIEILYRVTFRVEWTGANGRQNIQMQSLIANRRA